MRKAAITRKTKETDIRLDLKLNGGVVSISTGIGFFDHMLTQLAFYAGWGLTVKAKGDVQTGMHHTMEDIGIVLGTALNEALGNRQGIIRFASAIVPLDESLSTVALDISGRGGYYGNCSFDSAGGVKREDFEEFFHGFARLSRITLHVRTEGVNGHHMIESVFKALGMALASACAQTGTRIRSTKGTL